MRFNRLTADRIHISPRRSSCINGASVNKYKKKIKHTLSPGNLAHILLEFSCSPCQSYVSQLEGPCFCLSVCLCASAFASLPLGKSHESSD